MATRDAYPSVERMIYRGEIMLSDLERLLEFLHRHERITRSEQETLLELAWSRNINSLPPAYPKMEQRSSSL